MMTQTLMMIQTVMICLPHLDITAVHTVPPSFFSRVNLRGSVDILTYILTHSILIFFLLLVILNKHIGIKWSSCAPFVD